MHLRRMAVVNQLFTRFALKGLQRPYTRYRDRRIKTYEDIRVVQWN